MAGADVVYVSEEVSASQVAYKLRTATIGVINEEGRLDDEFGITTSNGNDSNSTTVTISDNTHAITAGFATGSLTIFNTSQPRTYTQGTVASGFQQLATGSGNLALGVIETGGTLANTYSGNNTASGRRVRLPWGGGTFAFSSLNANGLSILQNALAWASTPSSVSSGLIAQWLLDETGGTTAVDSSGNGHDGTYTNGVTLGNSGPYLGPGANAAGFDGFNDYVAIPNESAFDITNEITVSAWIKVDQFDATWQAIIAKGDSAWRFSRYANSDTLHFACSGLSTDQVNGSISVNDGRWHHIAGVYTGSSLRLYVDGQLDTSVSSSGTISTNNYDVAIGLNGQVSGREFDGDIYDVRVYGSGLTDDEVAELYGLVGHWKLDETSGTTANDSSLRNNDGTYTNGVTIGATGPPATGQNSAEFDGANDYVAVPNEILYDSVGPVAVAAWFKVDQFNTSWQPIVTKGATGWRLTRYNSTNTLSFANDGLSPGIVVGTTDFNDGQWHHAAGVYDGSSLRLYIDGVLDASVSVTGTPTANNNDLRIGSIDGGTPAYWDGWLSDVRFYYRPLSTQELASFYGVQGLVAHWDFDEGSGTTVSDSSSGGNNGAFNTGTPTWTSGVRGGALEFNGTNDVDTNSTFNPPSTGSVAFWFRPNGLPGGTQRLFGLSNSWEVRYSTNGTLTFDLAAGGGFNSITSFGDAGRWHHLVAIYNSSADTYSVYVDGKLVTSGSMTLIDEGAAVLSFGTRTGSTQYFAGALDDLRVYDYELTATEVADLYGLVGHWKFDEGTGITAADSTAFGNDATLNGATWTTTCSGDYALEFDGAGDTAATGAAFDPPERGTVAFWFRSAGTPASRQRPWGVGSDYEMWQDPDGLISCDVSTDGFQGGFITDTPLDKEDRWYHLVAEYDSDDDSYAIYIDGELHKSGISTWAMVKQAANTLTFGTRTGNTEYWQGAMRDFRVYNRPLLSYEIAELAGVIAHWALDETSGTVAVDESVNANHATYVNSPTLGVNGPYSPTTGTAVDLNGTDELIDSGQSLLNDLTEFTISGWVRPDQVAVQTSFFGQNDVIEVGLKYGTNQLHYWTAAGGQVNTTGSLPIGQWSHITAVGAGTELRLYVNGIEVASGGSATANYGTSAYNFKIGEGVYDPSGSYLNGRVDDVRVFSRAICPEEVWNLYKGGRPPGVRIIQWLETR